MTVRSAAIALLLTLACLAAQPAARAQQATPITAFRLTDWSGEAYFNSHYKQKDEKRLGSDNHETDTFYEAGVRLDFAGYVYHPNLIDLTAGLSLGYSQQTIDFNDLSRPSDGELLGYDFNALILKQKDIYGRLYASQSQQFITRSFARNIDSTQNIVGAELFRRGNWPMALTVELSNRQEQTTSEDTDEQAFYVKYELADQRYPDWLTELIVEHEDIDETSTFFPVGGTPTIRDLPDQRDEVVVRNRYRFGSDDQARQHTLDGQLRLIQREGIFSEDAIIFDQFLNLYHSDNLRSFYTLTYSDRQASAEQETVSFLEAGVTRKVYDSLVATGRVHYRSEQFTEGDDTYFGGQAELDYTKKTPWGQFSSYLELGRRWEQESFQGGVRTVLDEAVTLNGITPVALSQPNVLPGTIIVTDLANTFVYQQGVDYIVQGFGQFTEIVRVAGGNIASGQTVLVDYQTTAARNANYTTDTFRIRPRYEFKDLPLAVYAEYHLRSENLTGGTDPGTIETITRYMLGAEVTFGPLIVSAEHENLEQELSPPFTADRLRATYVQRFGQVTLNAGADYETRSYRQADQFGLAPGDEFLDSYGTYFTLSTRLQAHALLQADGMWRVNRGRTNDDLIRLGASLLWSYGQTEIQLGGYHETWTQEQDNGQRLYVQIGIIRRF